MLLSVQAGSSRPCSSLRGFLSWPVAILSKLVLNPVVAVPLLAGLNSVVAVLYLAVLDSVVLFLI